MADVLKAVQVFIIVCPFRDPSHQLGANLRRSHLRMRCCLQSMDDHHHCETAGGPMRRKTVNEQNQSSSFLFLSSSPFGVSLSSEGRGGVRGIMGNRQSTPSASCDLIRGRGRPITTIASLCARRLLPAGVERERMREEERREGEQIEQGRMDRKCEEAEKSEFQNRGEVKQREMRWGGCVKDKQCFCFHSFAIFSISCDKYVIIRRSIHLQVLSENNLLNQRLNNTLTHKIPQVGRRLIRCHAQSIVQAFFHRFVLCFCRDVGTQ